MTTIMRGKKLEEGEEGIEQELVRVKELLTTLSKVSARDIQIFKMSD
jgi:hypothetical protein